MTIEQPLIENGEIKIDKKGKSVVDTSKRDFERISLLDNVDEYFERKIKPHLKNSWMDTSKNKVGYEINFGKYFYKYEQLRTPEEILNDLELIDLDIKELYKEIDL